MPYSEHYLNNSTNNGYGWYHCECCPYGYHIDLDFVRYCESVSQEADRSGSIKRRKDRRRQRQSMEVLLGLTPPVVAAFEHNYKSIAELDSPEVRKDGFDDAVHDFEQTLQKSKKYNSNLPDVTAVSDNRCTTPKLSSISSSTGVSMTVAPQSFQSSSSRDFDGGIDSCGLTPAALQNIREQMALSLERTKELEDQVKLIPSLKAQLAALSEEKRQLLLQLKAAEASKVTNSINRNRSQSFSEIDNLDSLNNKILPRPPPSRRDFGVMCGVLTRNVGVGHQYPHTKNVSTLTTNGEETPHSYSDKWYNEKVKFLASQSVSPVTVTRNTQTVSAKKSIVECSTQTLKFEVPKPKCISNYTQTLDSKKQLISVGCNAKPNKSDALAQTDSIKTKSIAISIETPCNKCSIPKISIGVGSDNTADAHISPVSLANLAVPRSKSFNLGSDKLNLSAKNRSIGCQYEPTVNVNTVACQHITKTQSKACQGDVIKTSHKASQHEYTSTSKLTDTTDLNVTKKISVACEAKEIEKEKVDIACNTNIVAEKWSCAKCSGKEKETKEEALKKEGSPTPSRIPRLQVPTTPVENRKFRRQDTYTKIPAVPIAISPTGLSGLVGVPLQGITSESPDAHLDKVKTKLQETASSSTSPQNGVTTTVQVQEGTLPTIPVPDSTNLHLIADKPRQKVEPSKEMQAAMKVLNDSLQKEQTKNIKNQLKNATNIIQQEWFKISSVVTANPLDVEDYLDAFDDISSALLEYIVNMTDTSGNTAMHYAVSHGNFDVVSILLDSKVCDINKTNKAGYTSTMLVSLAEVRSQTHANVVRRLFKLADVNIRAKQHGQTALMLAVSHGRLDMVQMLLEAGADINIQDEDGSTALMCAAEHGHIEIVKHLLSQLDCDSSITDVDGSTALKIAMEAGHRHIGVLLYAHERNLHGGKHKKSKSTSASPKTPSSPLPFRASHRALTDPKQNK